MSEFVLYSNQFLQVNMVPIRRGNTLMAEDAPELWESKDSLYFFEVRELEERLALLLR